MLFLWAQGCPGPRRFQRVGRSHSICFASWRNSTTKPANPTRHTGIEASLKRKQTTPTFSTSLPRRQPSDSSYSVGIGNRTAKNAKKVRTADGGAPRPRGTGRTWIHKKFILTTNFDRLVETALRDEGIVPTILSSPDQVKGALPLIHTQCCVFKVHGDYLDTRIRNTPDELDGYPPEFDQLLDRIFDEFGLILCGWSAEWDGALRKAIYRTSSRRFTTYWAARGNPAEEAQRLIDHRGIQVIPIEDADTFFQTIQQSVESIEEFSRPHPLSTEAAVTSLKRYISESKYRIQLSDLVDKTVDRVDAVTSGKAFAVQGGPEPTKESATARVRSYEAACSTLLAMATVGGYWAEEEHYQLWQRALQRLGSKALSGGTYLWLELQRYPATLLLYALGLGAVEADRLQFLKRILSATLLSEHQENLHAVEILPPCCQFGSFAGGAKVMQILDGMEKRRVPLNDWIHDTLRPHAERIIPDNDRYTFVFDKFEILMALSYAHHKDSGPQTGSP